jgi:predicted secreted hydrolase
MSILGWSARSLWKTIGTLVIWLLGWQPPLEMSQLTTSNVVWAMDLAPAIGDGARSANDWQEAQPGYQFFFPRDHAAHPPYRLEWWYYTGNIETSEGRRFGYQLTFFRTGVTPRPTTPSQWAVRDLYMAHFAISDLEGKRFYSFERLNRAGVHWAGAEPTGYRVWNEGWEARLDGDVHVVSASDGSCTIALRLTPEKLPVIHGKDGLSQKGASAGNASHYYSYTRLHTSGTIAVDGQTFSVTGLSWMDHEFGTSFLEKDQVGWDWFSLQLQDGRELMLFQIRRADGSIDSHASGTVVEVNGSTTHLSVSEFSLVPEQYWQSPESGARYPIVWTLTLPSQDMQLRVTAALLNQELRTEASTGVTYWEGSVVVAGQSSDHDIQGRGYLEMTGYTGKSMGPVLGGP